MVESADFHKLLIKAQGIMDMYTFNRLKENAEIVDEVQNCCCELVECINTYENGISEKPSGVSSEKINEFDELAKEATTFNGTMQALLEHPPIIVELQTEY